MDGAAIAAWAGAAVALFGVVIAWWKADQARRSADLAEERANLARNLTALATVRLADAVEQIVTVSRGEPWFVEKRGTERKANASWYRLYNRSGEDTRDVHIAMSEGWTFDRQDIEVIAHGAYASVLIGTEGPTGDAVLTITWSSIDGTTAQGPWRTAIR